AAEKTLTTWARKNRYAGSKDRAALRDLVFDALRQQRSSVHMGGAATGRGIMLGQMRLQGIDLATIFSGEGYGPAPLSEDEAAQASGLASAKNAVRLDCPDWLFPLVTEAMGPATNEVLECLRSRAPVFLRVNSAKTNRNDAIKVLAGDDIDTTPHPLSPTALEVTRNPRRLRQSKAYLTGLVEFQDAASQAVTDIFANAASKGSVLDYCAGGGGKALALAAAGFEVTAHDSDVARMGGIAERAARAGTSIATDLAPTGPFDAVLCDAPCSGSGAWRRQPEAKWRLTSGGLERLNATQDSILEAASALVAPGGVLGYATCSLLGCENGGRIGAFLSQHTDWSAAKHQQFTPLDGGDGFFIAILRRT
ncbi:MAG: RsmB/NOP family class I SAM-dependent RNA methyltransferase, partial [Paracoccaceae bacterium]